MPKFEQMPGAELAEAKKEETPKPPEQEEAAEKSIEMSEEDMKKAYKELSDDIENITNGLVWNDFMEGLHDYWGSEESNKDIKDMEETLGDFLERIKDLKSKNLTPRMRAGLKWEKKVVRERLEELVGETPEEPEEEEEPKPQEQEKTAEESAEKSEKNIFEEEGEELLDDMEMVTNPSMWKEEIWYIQDIKSDKKRSELTKEKQEELEGFLERIKDLKSKNLTSGMKKELESEEKILQEILEELAGIKSEAKEKREK